MLEWNRSSQCNRRHPVSLFWGGPREIWRRNGAVVPIVLLLHTGCGHDQRPTASVADPGDSPDGGTIRVEHFAVPAGESVEYEAGTTIISESGASIDGDVVIDGSAPGDFRIVCESGELVVEGSIAVRNVEGGIAVRNASAPRERATEDAAVVSDSRTLIRTAKSAVTELPKGTSVVLEAHDQSRAYIRIGPGALLRSGDGQDAIAEVVVSGGGQIEATAGSDAGDIIITSFGGTIELPAGRSPDSPPIFHLGRGGHGADISVDREEYRTSDTSLQIVAGNGGESGRLVLEANQILNRPAVDDPSGDLMTGGEGGNGGHAVWDNAQFAFWSTPIPEIETKYSLEQIVLNAGHGGDGAVHGGSGGNAAYSSLREINERGDPIASASVYGGDGGDVFTSPLPISLVIGGDGGAYVVFGNNGWDGAPPDSVGPRDGADGGAALGTGGDGGDVLEGVTCHAAIGGDGGNSIVARTKILEDLPSHLTVGDFPYVAYSVQGGHGGDGTSRCDGCPGGDGGNNGMASAIGGDGGSVLAATRSVGGRGGDVWAAGRFGVGSGQGGNGNPPGSGGSGGVPTVAPGQGGGAVTPGEPGQVLRPPLETPDGRDGLACGEEAGECDDTPGDPDDPLPCPDGSPFTVTYLHVQTTPQFTRSLEIIANCEVYDRVGYVFRGGTSRMVFDDHVADRDTVITTVLNDGYGPTSAIAFALGPNCQMGYLQWGDRGGITVEIGDTRTTASVSGCPPNNYLDRDDYHCCVTESGNSYVCRE